jgi:formylglycine-generating enzyme required for sulfatase activity
MTMVRGAHPLVDGLPERWARQWGEDEHGAFVAFAVGKVAQRMRWVPPGKFTMGSPEGEAGRWADEGPQHEVEIRRGLWLAETPVTQALWVAVMGTNPSRFVSPDRPVEQVSWDDCQGFIEKLNGLVPGLDARLPTEAEWEYACRADTTTATWVGDLEILGDYNAPILDDIAWYGGNIGQGFELADGYNSSKWPDKQYPHTKAGTRPVGQKLPNALGLFDMLGNVFEWCEDWLGSYDATSVTDPLGPRTGSTRVSRGGSWNSYARYVRAAYRYAIAPGDRDGNLGFRLARGQVPGAEPASGAEPSPPRSGSPARAAGRAPGPGARGGGRGRDPGGPRARAPWGPPAPPTGRNRPR